jgi:hypothetical protein
MPRAPAIVMNLVNAIPSGTKLAAGVESVCALRSPAIDHRPPEHQQGGALRGRHLCPAGEPEASGDVTNDGGTRSWMKTSGVRRPNPRIAKHVLSSCCCFGIQQGLADSNARLFVSSPISVNRMCQENAGAEQSHKRPPIKFHLFPMRPLPPHGLEWEGQGPLGRGWAGKPKGL